MRRYDFAQGIGARVAGYADYSESTAPTDTVTEARPLPAPFTGSGLYSAGRNNNDDLFAYVKTRVIALLAHTTYRVTARVEFLTDAPAGCVGAGGAPGEGVWVVVAACAKEPVVVLKDTVHRLNIERGNQGASRRQGIVLGTIANGISTCDSRQWESRTLASPTSPVLTVTADDRGEARVLVGFDSGLRHSVTSVTGGSPSRSLPSDRADGIPGGSTRIGAPS